MTVVSCSVVSFAREYVYRKFRLSQGVTGLSYIKYIGDIMGFADDTTICNWGISWK